MFILIDFMTIDKQPNYFEMLEISNTTPTPLLVKKRYQSIMNRIAQESRSISSGSIDSTIIEDLEEEAQPKKGKKSQDKKKEKKSRKKKKRKDMTEEELKIDDKKKHLKEIYKCLMDSACY